MGEIMKEIITAEESILTCDQCERIIEGEHIHITVDYPGEPSPFEELDFGSVTCFTNYLSKKSNLDGNRHYYIALPGKYIMEMAGRLKVGV
jgi:hypothetical protein